ncbi:hypothetical protein ACIGCZ_14500 [Streptomyces nigra]|uniref:hypothetical protein n=1 Tax=Streptomyces nigra TaxID=1827580 RepID=UPI0037D44C86
MRRTLRTAALLMLGAALLAGAGACTAEDDARPAGERMPADPDQAQSRKNAEELRDWVRRHGDARQKEAVGRVRRIIRAGDGESGDAYVSTDINGGTTPVRDPLATAGAVAEAFAAWKGAEQGRVAVYDVFGNPMITARAF